MSSPRKLFDKLTTNFKEICLRIEGDANFRDEPNDAWTNLAMIQAKMNTSAPTEVITIRPHSESEADKSYLIYATTTNAHVEGAGVKRLNPNRPIIAPPLKMRVHKSDGEVQFFRYDPGEDNLDGERLTNFNLDQFLGQPCLHQQAPAARP